MAWPRTDEAKLQSESSVEAEDVKTKRRESACMGASELKPGVQEESAASRELFPYAKKSGWDISGGVRDPFVSNWGRRGNAEHTALAGERYRGDGKHLGTGKNHMLLEGG